MPTRSAMIAGGVTVAGGFALMAVHYLGGDDGDPEGWFSAMGFGAPFVAAGCLAMVGYRFAQPELCLAAGIALVPMSVVSIVLFPLLVAAAFMIVSVGKETIDLRTAIVPVMLGGTLVAIFAVLILHEDPVTWSTPMGGGSSSDIVTTTEASLSLAVAAAVVVASVIWSRRRARSWYRPLIGKPVD